MIWLLLASLVIPLLMGRLVTRRSINPVSGLALWWGLWLALGRLPFFDLDLPDNTTYLLLVLSVHGWCLGFCIMYRIMGHRVGSVMRRQTNLLDRLAEAPRISRILLVIMAVCAAFLALGAMRTVTTLGQDGGEWLARAEYYASGGATAFGSARLGLLRDILVKPLLYVIFGVAVVRLIRRPHLGSAAVFAAACALQIAYDLTFLGRGQAVSVLMLIVLAIAFGGRLQSAQRLMLNLRAAKSLTVAFLVLFLVTCGFIVSMSLRKAGNSEQSLMHVMARYVTYWMLPFTLFDQRASIIVPNDPFFYTLGGLYDLVILFGRRFGVEYLLPGRAMDLQIYLPIAPDRVGNAFATWCIAFYSDMGTVGVFLVPLCLGLIVGWLFHRYLRTGSASLLILLVFFCHLTLMGVLEWQLSWNEGMSSLLLLLCLFAIPRKRAGFPPPRGDLHTRSQMAGRGAGPTTVLHPAFPNHHTQGRP